VLLQCLSSEFDFAAAAAAYRLRGKLLSRECFFRLFLLSVPSNCRFAAILLLVSAVPRVEIVRNYRQVCQTKTDGLGETCFEGSATLETTFFLHEIFYLEC